MRDLWDATYITHPQESVLPISTCRWLSLNSHIKHRVLFSETSYLATLSLGVRGAEDKKNIFSVILHYFPVQSSQQHWEIRMIIGHILKDQETEAHRLLPAHVYAASVWRV